MGDASKSFFLNYSYIYIHIELHRYTLILRALCSQEFQRRLLRKEKSGQHPPTLWSQHNSEYKAAKTGSHVL